VTFMKDHLHGDFSWTRVQMRPVERNRSKIMLDGWRRYIFDT